MSILAGMFCFLVIFGNRELGWIKDTGAKNKV